MNAKRIHRLLFCYQREQWFLTNFSPLKEFQWQKKELLSWANHPSIKADLTRPTAPGFMMMIFGLVSRF